MGSLSIWHWLIVLAVVLLLFGGRGKLSQLMADFGKGLKAFKKSMKEEDEVEAGEAAPRTIEAPSAAGRPPSTPASPTIQPTDAPASGGQSPSAPSSAPSGQQPTRG